MLHPAIIGDSPAAWEQRSPCLCVNVCVCVCVCVCAREGGREITVYLKWLLLDSILALQALYLSIIFSSLADKNNKLPIRRGPGCWLVWGPAFKATCHLHIWGSVCLSSEFTQAQIYRTSLIRHVSINCHGNFKQIFESLAKIWESGNSFGRASELPYVKA